MHFEHLHLLAIRGEVHPWLGARLHKAVQPSPHEVALALRRQGETRWLLLSIHPQRARVHWLQGEPQGEETPFVATLRQWLRGAVLRKVEQIHFDRILHLAFQGEDRWGQPTFWSLIAEFMGRHSNLALVNREGIVLAPLKPVSHRVNRYREMLPGVAYVPPPPDGKRNPFQRPWEAWEAWWQELPPEADVGEAWRQTFRGGTPLFWEALTRTAGLPRQFRRQEASQETLRRMVAALEALAALGEGRFQAVERREGKGALLLPLPPEVALEREEHPLPSLSLGVERWALEEEQRARLEQRKGEIRSWLRRLQRRLETLLQEAQEVEAQAQRASQYRRWGELLLAYASQVPSGAAEVEVEDFVGGERVRIPLEEHRSLVENAQRYFQQARKAERRLQAWKGRKAALETHLTLCRQWALALEEVLSLEELEERARDIASLAKSYGLPLGRRTSSAPSKGRGVEEHLERRLLPGGWEVLLGRNAEENEHLLRVLSQPEDIWLHARGVAGAHVLLRTQGHPERVPPQVLEAAARWAAWHSPARHSGLVPVDYTLRKYVHKPKGSPPGHVLYRHEKTLFVEPEPLEEKDPFPEGP